MSPQRQLYLYTLKTYEDPPVTHIHKEQSELGKAVDSHHRGQPTVMAVCLFASIKQFAISCRKTPAEI